MNQVKYLRHEVKWTDEKVERFWNHYNQNKSLSYFAKDVGNVVIDFATKYTNIEGNVLDYGSGKGYLIGYLLKRKLGVISGVDFSSDSVKFVNERFKNEKSFKECSWINGLPTPLNSNQFDNVFFLETIEHLLDNYFASTLSELNRILKKEGKIILTTRNNENLDLLKVNCPDCGCSFHRVQHVRSFTADGLVKLMDDFGFSNIYCGSTNFSLIKNESFSKIRSIYRWIRGKDSINKSNLIYIGKKTKEI